jgi:AraC family transcriptional regulator
MAPSLLHRTADEMGLPAERARLGERHQFRDAQIEHIALALDAERRAGFPNGTLYTDSLGTALAVHLIAGQQIDTAPAQGLTRPQLRRVTEYIEANLDGDLSLSTLAAIAGLSASHLKTQFKRSTGLPVHEYVVHRRVDRARAACCCAARCLRASWRWKALLAPEPHGALHAPGARRDTG